MPHATRLVRLCLSLLLLSIALPTLGQSTALSTVATPDGDVTLPGKTGVIGHKDEGAVAEVEAHVTAVGGSHWVGMVGTGKITYGADPSVSYDATLSNSNGDAYRLDAGAKSGETSIRIYRGIGKVQESDGRISSLPSDGALSGLFPFEIARADLTSQTASSISLIDHGMTTIGAVLFHRVSLESPALHLNSTTKTQETHVIDLYFDPSTHLLAKSAVYETVAGSRAVKFLFVVSYGDYRRVGEFLVPFLYTETMEGIPYRTLQLSSIQINSNLNANDFAF